MMGRWSPLSLLVGFVAGALCAVLVMSAVFLLAGDDDSGPSSAPRQYQDFSSATALDHADTGQTWEKASNGVPGAELRVVDGWLANAADADGPAAGYISADLGAPVTRMSATFRFSAGGTHNGSAVLAVFKELLPETLRGHTNFDSPCHLVVTPLKVDFGVASDGVVTVLRTEVFPRPLDYGREYSTSVELDYRNSAAQITGPDGQEFAVSDPRISVHRSGIATFEIFQQMAKSDDRASFRTVAAS